MKVRPSKPGMEISHEGNVGMSLREECKCFLTIAGLADHGHMWQTFQQRAYACTNQIVIINEDYSYRYAFGHCY